jgi:ATP-binding cassette subfamily F protein uup
VLDEPTNDLDLETLELLEAKLVEFPGTLLLVSHDRVFLDNVVTSTLAFEGDGRIQEYAGGYEDWLRQRGGQPGALGTPGIPAAPRTPGVPGIPATLTAPGRTVTGRARVAAPVQVAGQDTQRADRPSSVTKLSHKERREFGELPVRIEALEGEQRALSAAIAAPEFYKEPAATITGALARLDEIRGELDDLYARWDALDSRAK